MKNYIYIFIILILLGLSSILIKDDTKTFKVDGIKYAVSIDGETEQNFPEKGPYDVAINCTNADSYWNYEDWVAEIYNVTNEVSCNISFTSKAKVYLNSKVTSLTGQTSGTGQVVKEEPSYTDVDYSQATALTQSEYGTPITFSSVSYTSTSGTTVSNAFSFSNNSWSSVPANLTSNTYYHFIFDVPNAGYYRLCYTMSTGSSSNQLYLYKNTTQVIIGTSSYVSASSSSEQSGCVEIGALTTSDYIKVSQRAYTTIATVNFYIEKTTAANPYTLQAGYRYEGKNPDNYIKFNNEMWRIIGVFDATSHGQTGLNLTKIIRNKSIGGYTWGKRNVNIWPNSNLYNLLNTYYYNSDNGQDSGYCYQYSTTITGHCDYTNTGIQDYYRPMIKNVTWYLGGYFYEGATTENFFLYERSTSDDNYYSSNTGYKTTTGYIGLMYPSDYGYSVLSGSCARTTSFESYNTEACGGSSWLKKEANEWTLSHHTSYSDIIYTVLNDGTLYSYSTYSGAATRPTLYLDSSVYIINGTGTESDPYIIAMDENN